ncbi:hypothetical protein Glove_329g73 [Diversispora epigaea]|uniref:Uncharacterized protein n=1 Tax=Diversispora epigaea TaxID=1348612 RepID=A0A397HPG0_9GLOM|nr:hypothetical protein Glove_329g73 [Diversispora epigaea]
MNEQSTESKTHRDLTPEYLKWQAKITVAPGISIDEIRPKLHKRYEKKTGLDSWINSESSQIMTNIQPKIDLPELVWQRFEDFWNEVKIFPEEEMIFERVLESRSFEDKDWARIHNKCDNLHDKEEVETENIKLKQELGELESKKNRKFQEKCILIAQILLNEKPINFRNNRIALEVQGAQHRLHHTGWYKDIKKLEDIVNRDRKKRCICQDNGIFLLEVWYDEKPEIVIPERIRKIKCFVNQASQIFDP